MARPTKTGMDYFPLDVQLSDEVEAVESVHGNDGFTVIVKAWQALYQTENGVLDCSGELRRKTFAKRANMTEERWIDVIGTCVEAGLFDREPWETGRILTSNGVRKRIAKVYQEREEGRKRAEKRWKKSSTPKNPAENEAQKRAKEREKEKETKKERERETEREDNGAVEPGRRAADVKEENEAAAPGPADVAGFFGRAGIPVGIADRYYLHLTRRQEPVGDWKADAVKWLYTQTKERQHDNATGSTEQQSGTGNRHLIYNQQCIEALQRQDDPAGQRDIGIRHDRGR